MILAAKGKARKHRCGENSAGKGGNKDVGDMDNSSSRIVICCCRYHGNVACAVSEEAAFRTDHS